MLKMNQTYNWKDIVAHYPSMYVVIADVKDYAGEIVICKLLDVCTKAEKHLYRKKYIDLGIKFQIQRTTCENDPNSGVCFLED